MDFVPRLHVVTVGVAAKADEEDYVMETVRIEVKDEVLRIEGEEKWWIWPRRERRGGERRRIK